MKRRLDAIMFLLVLIYIIEAANFIARVFP